MFKIDKHKSKINLSHTFTNENEVLDMGCDEEALLEKLVLGKSLVKKRFFDDGELDIEEDKNFEFNKEETNKVPAWEDPDDAQEINVNSKNFGIARPQEKNIPGMKYNQQIKKRYQKSMAHNTDWVTKKHDIQDEFEDLEFSHQAYDYIAKGETGDPIADSLNDSNLLKYKWLRNLKNYRPSIDSDPIEQNSDKSPTFNFKMNIDRARITSLKFHSKYQVLLSSNINGLFRLNQIDGKGNKELQRIELENFAISGCDFITPEKDQILFVGSNVRYLHTFDLLSGKISKISLKTKYTSVNPRFCQMSQDGQYIALYAHQSGKISLLSQKSKEFLHNFYTTSSNTRAVLFSPDSRYLLAISEMGEISAWDLYYFRNSKCSLFNVNLMSFSDKGNYQATVLDLTADGKYLFTGSHSGVINVYDINSSFSTIGMSKLEPVFVKSLKNISTPITLLKSNPQSQLLLAASNYKQDCVKMVNLQNLSVYSNFPTAPKKSRLKDDQTTLHTYLNKVNASDFSPSSGYIAIGSDKGDINLYRLKAYGQY
ncbi:unnamed protein product [Gordionus sp. m RMFG-2023]|uniref:U3 small nucleolar RNA-associated protein 18 homolog n=1 Tax=Gordionus sp. m RMFG-2023 TaxID=3053472 RepID=UPI0030DE2417